MKLLLTAVAVLVLTAGCDRVEYTAGQILAPLKAMTKLSLAEQRQLCRDRGKTGPDCLEAAGWVQIGRSDGWVKDNATAQAFYATYDSCGARATWYTRDYDMNEHWRCVRAAGWRETDKEGWTRGN